MNKISRRRFLTLSALAVPAVIGADARWVEPTSLRVTNLKLNKNAKCRFVHFTDFHHKGDVDYAAKMVRTINELKPEFVCFTGDIVENKRFLPEALHFIHQIKAPVYGNPGNHDYWSGASFPDCERAFGATGGAWLVDRSIVLPQHDLELVGMAMIGIHAFKDRQTERRILPFYGALAVPWGVGRYDLGFFETPGGPLYVNAGIGTYRIPYRFNCRPEITVVTI